MTPDSQHLKKVSEFGRFGKLAKIASGGDRLPCLPVAAPMGEANGDLLADPSVLSDLYNHFQLYSYTVFFK